MLDTLRDVNIGAKMTAVKAGLHGLFSEPPLHLRVYHTNVMLTVVVIFVKDICLWSPYGIGRPYIFSCCGLFFFLLLSFFFLA